VMRARLPRSFAASLAASVLAFGLAACGSSGTGSSSVAVVGPLADAAAVTSQAGGAHMSLSASIQAGALPSPVTMSGGGYFNYASHEGKLAITLAGLPANEVTGSSASIEEILDRNDIYVGSSLFAGKLPGGARWMKLDIARFGQAAGIDPSQLLGGQSNPAQLLEYLKASGGAVQIAGHEAVRGVPTTHYRGTVDLAKAAAAVSHGASSSARAALEKSIAKLGVGSVPVDVWVDSHRLVRRIALAFSAPAGGQQLGLHMTIELFDFGATPAVTAPAASETFDATSSALGGLSAIGR
jgi:hypothetical protein